VAFDWGLWISVTVADTDEPHLGAALCPHTIAADHLIKLSNFDQSNHGSRSVPPGTEDSFETEVGFGPVDGLKGVGILVSFYAIPVGDTSLL
jgi:hypothetical protein